MNPALGPFAIAAVLLVVGGAAKAVRPHDTAVALRGAGLPVKDPVVRLGGAAEVALGLVALADVDSVVAFLVAASYGAFFAFVTVALIRRLPISSCGCLGRFETPPTPVHLGVDLGALLAAFAVAFDPSPSPLTIASGQLPESAAYALLVAAGALASLVALTLLPRALAATTPR